jgi:hypothetical protein
MKETENEIKINPKHELGILRRYLHVIALLQNQNDPKSWNSNTLADVLSEELINEGYGALDDKNIRDDIEKYIENDLGLEVNRSRGKKKMTLVGINSEETLLSLLQVYSNFVIHDASRNHALIPLIKERKDICLWLLARIHFAIVCRKIITFDYVSNNNNRSKATVSPYYILQREENIFLVGKRSLDNTTGQYYLTRIENLEVLDAEYEETPPSLEDLYSHSLGAYIWNDVVQVTLRYKSTVDRVIKMDFESLEPKVQDIDPEWKEMTFLVTNYEAVCRKLFLYGDQAYIVSPAEVRIYMEESLRESLSVYDKLQKN